MDDHHYRPVGPGWSTALGALLASQFATLLPLSGEISLRGLGGWSAKQAVLVFWCFLWLLSLVASFAGIVAALAHQGGPLAALCLASSVPGCISVLIFLLGTFLTSGSGVGQTSR